MGGIVSGGFAEKVPRDEEEVFTHFGEFCVETMAGKSILQECVSEEIFFLLLLFINFLFILNISPRTMFNLEQQSYMSFFMTEFGLFLCPFRI